MCIHHLSHPLQGGNDHVLFPVLQMLKLKDKTFL
jgi:hypothetical protein